MEQNEIARRIVIVGQNKSGHSSLCFRYVDGTFSEYNFPFGIDYKIKNVKYKDINYKFKIWIERHSEKYLRISKLFYLNSEAILLVFDLTNKDTLPFVTREIESIKEYFTEDTLPILCIVGTKKDLEEKREVSKEEGIALSKQYGCKYFESSSKTGEGVEEIFNYILEEITLKNNSKKEVQSSNVKNENKKKCMIF